MDGLGSWRRSDTGGRGGDVVRTIGVAIGIPEPWGSQLDSHRKAAGDPLAAVVPAHLTLLGPTDVDADADAVEGHLQAAAAAHRPFQLHLRGTGTFRPVTQVVFVAVAAGTTDCEQLASAVRSGPLACPLSYPYHPHVTVAQDVPELALDAAYHRLATFEARFPVNGFTLYEHIEAGRWQPQRRFPLGG